MATVYIETSVISYLTARPSPAMLAAAHQQVTREWWDHHRHRFEQFISPPVLAEAARGDPDAAARRLTAHGSFGAATRTWDNDSGDGLWSTPENWSDDTVPVAGDDVVFDEACLSNCVADAVIADLGSITLASAYTNTVLFLAGAVGTDMTLAVTGDIVLEAGQLVFEGDTSLEISTSRRLCLHGSLMAWCCRLCRHVARRPKPLAGKRA